MRPQIRNEFFFGPSPEGVSFSGFGPDGQLDRFTLKGRLLYPIMNQLYPWLNGQHETEQILQKLPVLQRKLAGQMIEILAGRGFIRYRQGLSNHHLSETELELYASQINFIGCYADEPESRFEKFRKANVLLVGAGWTAACTAQALWANGLRLLGWYSTDSIRLTEAELTRLLRQAHQFDATAALHRLNFHQPPDWSAYDLVLFVSDSPDLGRLEEVAEKCRAKGIAFYPAYFKDGRGRLGPLELPGQPGCWHCAGDGSEAALANWPGVPDPFFSPVAAGLLGNTLAYRVFRYFTFFAGPENRSLFSFDTETLEQREKLVVWQPECAVCRSVASPVLAG